MNFNHHGTVITLNLDRQAASLEDDAVVIADNLTCVVKWFRQEDGYGFLQSPEIDQDIFIHSSKLDPVEAPTLIANDVLVCRVVRGMRGPQVDEVYEYLPFSRNATSKYKEGIIKWFNVESDFGFIKEDGSRDVFLPGKKVRKLGIDIKNLKPNQKVSFTSKVDTRGNRVVDELLIDAESMT